MRSGVSPAVLIAVTAITAFATLAGAVIAAWISARNTRNTLEHTARQAESDREEERRAQCRTARRDVYAAYSTAALLAVRDISRMLYAPLDDRAEERSVARASQHDLVVAIGPLSIEGPEAVYDAARPVMSLVAEYRQVAKSREWSDAKVVEARNEASQAVSTFLRACSTALNE
ncbi:hypothetical protein ACWGJT_34540 [Streptomyces xantholiticus]